MKLRPVIGHRPRRVWADVSAGAFSLVELLMASTVLLLVALALVSSNISGARISRLVQQQTDGQLEERRVTMLLKEDIAEARRVEIGQGSLGALLVATNGRGNGLRLTFDGSGVRSRIYFLDGNKLWRSDDTNLFPAEVLAHVTNDVTAVPPFTAVPATSLEDGWSESTPPTSPTNETGRALVRVRLQLSTLGGQSFVVAPNATFQGNEIEFFASQRVN